VAQPYVPRRGDLVFTDFDPAAGHEQRMKRPALVLSPDAFNAKLQLALVAPITSRERGHGFEVRLEGLKTTGVVLCQHVRVIDYEARGLRFVEQAPPGIVDTVLAKVRLLVS
jgi:mRNA interferase MazF